MLNKGQVYTTKVGEAHNVYMPGDAVIHTIKHGADTAESDWYGNPELDLKTQSLNEAEIQNLVSK